MEGTVNTMWIDTPNNTNYTSLGKYGNRSHQNSRNNSDENTIDGCLTTYCLPIAITLSTVSATGLVTNLIVIIVIARDKRLHSPTFVILCSLALADFSFLLARYPRYIIQGYFMDVIQKDIFLVIKMVCDVVGLLAGASSICHLVLLSALRYFIVVHPFKSHVLLTNKRVLIMCCAMWMFSACISALYTYAILIKGGEEKELMEITNIIITVFMSILPVVLITALHLLKAKVLLKSVSNCTKIVRNMSRVVTFVIISFIITMTPSNVIDVMIISFGYTYTKTRWFFVTSQIARVLLFLNFAINPFIYFVHSIQFRKSIAKCCCGQKHRHFGSSCTGCSQNHHHLHHHHHGSMTMSSSIRSTLPETIDGIQLQSCKHINGEL